MGKQKHEKPAANLDGNDPAGAAGGTENLAAAGEAGTVPEKPADAVSATSEAGGDQPAAQPAGANTGAALPGAAVAAESQEAEKEVGDDGQAAQTLADGEQAGAAPGQRDPHQAGEPADGNGVAGGAAALGNAKAGADRGRGAAEDDELAIAAEFSVADMAGVCASAGRFFATRDPYDSARTFSREEANIMAAFVRDNTEAPLLAMYKHLELTLHLPETIPNNGDMLALSLFRHACKAGFYFERLEAAEAGDLGRLIDATPAASWGGATAMDPIKPALQPTGFSPL